MSDESPRRSTRDEVAHSPMTRRGLLAAAGAGGLAALYGLGAAKASGAGSAPWLQSELAGTVTLRLERLRPGAEDGVRRTSSRRSPRRPASKVKINTVDHNTFQEQINSYLQGRPDDVFTWFAGYRMQFFAQKGLRRRSTTSGRRCAAVARRRCKAASTGLDGHQYFVPIYNYPWAVFYRKSVFKAERLHGPEDLGPVHRARRRRCRRTA